jgi:sugar phosphate isomerase/epimerase
MCWPPGKAERKYAGVTHLDVRRFGRGDADRVRSLCREHGVEISALGYYPNLLDPDTARARSCAAHLRKVIEAAEMLGLKTVNTFAGRNWKKTVEENWPAFLHLWRPLIAFAEDHGVRVGIENCPMLFTADEWPGGKNLMTSPAIWRRAFSEISSAYFGLNYDPSHLVLQQIDPLKPLAEFSRKLFHVHAKDVLLQRDKLNEVGAFAFPAEWHQPRIPGCGEINWNLFIASLREAGYDGAVCVEVEDATFGKSLAGRKQALRVARNLLSAHFSAPQASERDRQGVEAD